MADQDDPSYFLTIIAVLFVIIAAAVFFLFGGSALSPFIYTLF